MKMPDYNEAVESMAKDRQVPGFADRFPNVTRCNKCFGRGFLGQRMDGSLIACGCVMKDFRLQKEIESKVV